MVSARPATQADFRALAEPMRKTSRAIAIEHDGALAAVAGYYMHNGSIILFSNITPEARKAPGFGRYVLRFAKTLMREAVGHGMPILAGADAEIARAQELLEHLGFRHEYKEVYSWHGHH